MVLHGSRRVHMTPNPLTHMAPEAPTGSEQQDLAGKPVAASQSDVRTTILVVDDRLPDREYLVTLLEHAGYAVLQATEGADALRKVREEQPDLVVTDALMPTMDGFELVRQIREQGETKDIPVILCTASYNDEAARDLVARCPETVILWKPLQPELLRRTVAHLLRSSEGASTQMPEDFQSLHLRLLSNKLYQSVEQREPELTESKQQLLVVTKAVPALILFLDVNQRCQFANETCRDWLRLDPESLYGKPLVQVLGEQAYERVRLNVGLALAGQRVVFEMQQMYGDILRHIRATYVPDCNANGEVRGMLSVEEDITSNFHI